MTKILCIEDEAELREDIVEELREAGYDMFEAANGRVGYDAIVAHKPDLVLCDVNMPDMNGYELLTKLRDAHAEYDDVPFVFLSALADRKDIIAGKKLGADDYLTKPVDFEMLLVTVESRLRQIVRINRHKEEQLVRLYRALSGTPEPVDDPASAVIAGNPMTVVAVVDAEFDLSEIRMAVEAGGHMVIEMNSGKQFLDCQESITPDLLLVSFNTSDMQAPMMVRLLKNAAYPKVLMIPPSMSGMDRFDSLPGFDATVRWPCPADELQRRISALQGSIDDPEADDTRRAG
ncbi:MAG: response regulator [Alphaproteobacteria bacterium]